MDDVGVGSILDYAVEEDLEKSDAIEMEMDSCSSGPGSKLRLCNKQANFIFVNRACQCCSFYCSINLTTSKRYS